MRSLHLTLALFCHLILASVVIYFTSLSEGSPLLSQDQAAAVNAAASKQAHKSAPVASASPPQYNQEPDAKTPAIQPAKSKLEAAAAAYSPLEARSSPAAGAPEAAQPKEASAPSAEAVREQQKDSTAAKAAPISMEKTAAPAKSDDSKQSVVGERKAPTDAKAHAKEAQSHGDKQVSGRSVAAESTLTKKDSDTVQPSTQKQQQPRMETGAVVSASASPVVGQQQQQQAAVESQPAAATKQEKVAESVPQAAALVAGPAAVEQPAPRSAEPAKSAPAEPKQMPSSSPSAAAPAAAPADVAAAAQSDSSSSVQAKAAASPVSPTSESGPAPVARETVKSLAARPPVVMGGLGPLHLLATTLCSYQPDKPMADENLNQLYARRASVRRSLFDFMSLKFTNLEKLSSRLGYGLQVVPAAVAKSPADESSSKGMLMPSHGWPVVGKCTAYDLKLMGEAAWCECQESENCANKQEPAADSRTRPTADEEEKPAAITSNQHAASTTSLSNRVMSGRSIDGPESSSGVLSLLPSPEESSVISKILHVGDIKSAPLVESSIYNLNLTQHQLATLEAHATSTQECRRNALRYSKALFNHLAEDQRHVSDSWPKLYAALAADDCARKRVIDIMNALSSFRTDTTSIRRDNLEFAFAMDDLRAKVLENEVNVPLTFDRHFIEVEQFLQQSVRLMLANIQPKRAKLTSMRYRSLMYGSSSDEQCIDLHQRLLARNYPNDCNPTQFGQLPDVLRMTANSLELWSIEKELSMRMAKVVDYPNESPAGQQKVKEDVNECIANLVSS
jgi:hypothetical protein